jgi:hypothetical protein
MGDSTRFVPAGGFRPARESPLARGELVGDGPQAEVVQVLAQLLIDRVDHQQASSASCA